MELENLNRMIHRGNKMEDHNIFLKKSHHLIKNLFIKHDAEAVVSYLHQDCSWVGPCSKEFFTKRDTIYAYLYDIVDNIPICELSDEEYKVVHCSDQQVVVMGKYKVKISELDRSGAEFEQHCTMVYSYSHEKWLVSHLHTSNTLESILKENNGILQEVPEDTQYKTLMRLLNEKNEIIEMIDSNVRCGLKGSNDDDTFSYYYVNEGLYRMLGYTYDEFMEMSGGSAVGTVYPPDLANALDDVARCFAVGVDYSAEYRIRKKDGSLMWVIDLGRKYQNKSGQTQINSILMDITELKQYQINLQLEQERYRIALENITDEMFEYDIRKDYMIKYERINTNNIETLEKNGVENYFESLEQGNRVHLDDIGLFKEFLLGTIDEKVISIRLFIDEDNWKWIEVHGTRVYEDSKPLKFIGIWKDITSEKIERERLIDLAQRDALTGLYHLKSLEEPISEILKKDTQCAMLIMDIDDFKSVNDRYGHLKGNDILVAVKDILIQHKKEDIYISRIGGDEFMIFFSNDAFLETTTCAKAILKAVKDIRIKDIKVTVSIGIAYSHQGDSFKRVFKKADTAMYHAKNNGKNQISIFDETM